MARHILPIDLEAVTLAALDRRAGSVSHRAQAMILAAALSENTPFVELTATAQWRPTSVSVDSRVMLILKRLSDLRRTRQRSVVICAAHTPTIVERYVEVMNLSTRGLEETIANLHTATTC